MDRAERESAYDLFQRGSRLLADHHPAAAAVLLERCLALEPGKASILEALGRAYFNSGQHEPARATFERVLELDPSAPYAHYALFGLGLSLARLGEVAAGRRHLRMAVFLKPENEDYRRALRRIDAA